MSNIGIIDIGSNTIHLMIAKINSDSTVQILDQDKEHLRLGANIKLKRNIDSEKILETVTTIKKYLRLCILYKASDVIAIATEALRVAENSKFIIDYIAKHTGLNIKVLTKEEEAFLSYLGVCSIYQIKDGIIVDLGGGSTEFIYVKNNEFQAYVSIPYGAINITENIKVTEDGKFLCCSYDEMFFNEAFSKVKFLDVTKNTTLTGIGGTFKNLKNCYLSNKGNKPTHCSFLSLPASEISKICTNIKSMSSSDREKLKGLSRKRSDIILGGCELILNLIKYNNFENVNICEEGLRTGVLSNYLTPKINI